MAFPVRPDIAKNRRLLVKGGAHVVASAGAGTVQIVLNGIVDGLIFGDINGSHRASPSLCVGTVIGSDEEDSMG